MVSLADISIKRGGALGWLTAFRAGYGRSADIVATVGAEPGLSSFMMQGPAGVAAKKLNQ